MEFDDDREWIQYYIEDEEWQEYIDQWNRENILGYQYESI